MAVASLALWLTAVVAEPPAAQAAAPDCATVAVGKVSCFGLLSPTGTALRAQAATATTSASGLGPVALRYAYGLEYSALTGGVGQTVAVVTPYDDTTALPDLTAYRATYSLPPCGSGCFTKVDQTGGTNYPPAVSGWSAGVAQALDMISAVCPNCHLLLVEATSTLFTDLGTAENTAVQLGAKFVTNNWFTPELTFQPGDEANLDAQYFNHPGVVITAADGNGAGNGNTYYPAASPDVIAVGGTTLTRDASTVRGWKETAWSTTGSGCSPSEAKPSWQTDTCTNRMLNDVSAVADTDSGVAYFDTESNGLVPGTSGMFAAALVAGAYALAGTPASGSNPASYLYAHHGVGLVADITSGSTGTCSGPAYYCTAGAGYDGPSGLGAPTSAMALGAHAPSDSLTGGPATYDPLNGAVQVFGIGTANGTVWGDTWTRSGGWSGWGNMSGTLSGKPLSALYDPGAGTLEVYGLAANGHVTEDWTSDGATWAGWHDLAGTQTFAFAPSAVYNPLSGSLDVWAVATSTGAAFENSWHAGTGWSGWQNRGGGFNSSLHAVYEPDDRTMRVFGVGKANGNVWGASVTSSGAFSGWGNMSGTLSSTPLSALYDPAAGKLEVYGLAADGHVTENFTGDGTSWNGWHDLGGTVAFGVAPSALYDPLSGSLELWTVATTTTAFDNSWAPGTGWSGWQNRSGFIGSGLFPLYDPTSGSLRVFGVGRSNGTVWGASLTPSGGFSGWGNMSGTLQTSDF